MKKRPLLAFITFLFFFFRSGYGQENLSFTVNDVSFNMIFVEGGTFVMGCTQEQGTCFPDERPTHTVTLTDFFMGEFEVTQKLWYAVMGTTLRQQWLWNATADREYWAYLSKKIKESSPEIWALMRGPINVTSDALITEFYAEDFAKIISINGEGDNYPVYFINYNECELFCNRLNQLLSDQLPEGYKFRIPTEAQWEYAARGGKMSQGFSFSGSNNMNEAGWYEVNSEKTHMK